MTKLDDIEKMPIIVVIKYQGISADITNDKFQVVQETFLLLGERAQLTAL